MNYKKQALDLHKKLKAKTACELSGQNISDHFADVGKTIEMPKTAKKEIDDLMLTRYACYLIAQNGDFSQKMIKLIKDNYFVFLKDFYLKFKEEAI
ncbi:hypothetical protein ACFL5N_00525 [bacterium]